MNNINSINNFASLKKFPCYIRGDYVPQISPFLQQLKKYDPKFRMSEMNRNIDINIKNEFQYFPFQDKKAYDLNSIIFQWVVVNKAMPPWQTVGNNLSLVEETINSHKIKPMLIILDNFSWNGSKIELKKMLARMKKNGTGVIIITNELPPNNFLSDKILDNIIKIQPGRKDLCAPNNITLQFLKMNGLTQKRRYHFFSYDGFKWHEKYEFYDFLRPYVEDMMNKGCSAKEIVFFINYECTFLKRPMTTANLARLKRQWGLRSYKPEKKPRNTKQSKNHKVLDLFSKE